MKKTIAISLIMVMLLVVLTGCSVNETKEDESNVTITEDLVNEDVAKVDIDVQEEIESASRRYFDMLYGDKIENIEFSNIKVYEGEDLENLTTVDLAVNDYAFEIDYELKPADEEYVEELTEYAGEYNKETGLVVQKQGYGVMRYNNETNEYDVTSITSQGF